MSLKIKCDKCDNDLSELGGLAFSPPTSEGHVIKLHLCKSCWKQFTLWLNGFHQQENADLKAREQRITNQYDDLFNSMKASRYSVKAEAVMECMDILRDNDICGFRDAIHLLDDYLLTLTQGKDNSDGGDV